MHASYAFGAEACEIAPTRDGLGGTGVTEGIALGERMAGVGATLGVDGYALIGAVGATLGTDGCTPTLIGAVGIGETLGVALIGPTGANGGIILPTR